MTDRNAKASAALEKIERGSAGTAEKLGAAMPGDAAKRAAHRVGLGSSAGADRKKS